MSGLPAPIEPSHPTQPWHEMFRLMAEHGMTMRVDAVGDPVPGWWVSFATSNEEDKFAGRTFVDAVTAIDERVLTPGILRRLARLVRMLSRALTGHTVGGDHEETLAPGGGGA